MVGRTHPQKEDNYLIERENGMKKRIVLAAVVVCVSMMSAAAFAAGDAGEAVFKAKCASCHPDGGNIMKPKATLKGIKDSKKIIKQVRKGGGGMPAGRGATGRRSAAAAARAAAGAHAAGQQVVGWGAWVGGCIPNILPHPLHKITPLPSCTPGVLPHQA